VTLELLVVMGITNVIFHLSLLTSYGDNVGATRCYYAA
jgi:hypothetical protein